MADQGALERDLAASFGFDEEQLGGQDKQEEGSSSEHTEATVSQQPVKVTLPDGSEATLAEIEEWRKGYLREADYTRKTQSLAEERRALEAERQRLQGLVQLERYLQQHPQLVSEIRSILEQKGYVPASHTPVVTDPKVASLEEQLAELRLERDLATLRRRADADRAKLGLSPLSDEAWERVSAEILNSALQMGTSNLLAVYRLSPHYDQWVEEAVKGASAKAVETSRQKQAQLAGSVIQGTPKQPPKQSSVPPASKLGEEAIRAALADLKASGVSLYTEEG